MPSPELRRYRIQYGQLPGEKGYVIADSEDGSTGDWRGRVLETTSSLAIAVAKADALNKPVDQ